MKIFWTALVVASLAAPALADETQGEILAFDRKAGLIILTDKTVWSIPGELEVPADLGHGDKIALVFEGAGEDGIAVMESVTRISAATN